MLTLLPKGVQRKKIKIFLVGNFFPFPLVSTTPVVHLELRITPRFLKKFESALMVFSGAQGLGGNFFMKKARS
jgi:hypothetical protein